MSARATKKPPAAAKAICALCDNPALYCQECAEDQCGEHHYDEEYDGPRAEEEAVYLAGFERALDGIVAAFAPGPYAGAIQSLVATIRSTGPNPTDRTLDLERLA